MEDPRQLSKYEKKHKEDPEDLSSAIRLLRVYRMTNNPKMRALAERILEKAEKKRKEGKLGEMRQLLTEAYLISASALMHRKELELARDGLEIAVELLPECGPAHFMVGALDRMEKVL